jgi:ADP-ribosyl-[dinitrogen reductase] hydrolase
LPGREFLHLLVKSWLNKKKKSRELANLNFKPTFLSPLNLRSTVKVGPSSILMTHLPGKNHIDEHGQKWKRSIDFDLMSLCEWGAVAVVCLVEKKELSVMGVPNYFQDIENFGLMFFHFPIKDMSVPEAPFFSAWKLGGKKLKSLISQDSKIVLHCAAGLGRTGMVCASLLKQQGYTPQAAIRKVRAARPGAIENIAQEKFVLTSTLD